MTSLRADTGSDPADRRGVPLPSAPRSDPAAAPLVRFEAVTKRFGDFVAVDDLSLVIYEREFFALLGPSGCGKTTLMRMVAGFEKPNAGQVLLDGQDLAGAALPAAVNMMFQSYALFPHMTVEHNVAFGLKQDGCRKPRSRRASRRCWRWSSSTQFAKRKPHQLSGGQRQRVALARSLAKKPKVLLLDEPLGALDKKLREETQFELIDLQMKLGLTFLIVTHDQEEAMTVADRIARDGSRRLIQVATPAGDLRAAELALRRRLHRRHQPARRASARGNGARRGPPAEPEAGGGRSSGERRAPARRSRLVRHPAGEGRASRSSRPPTRPPTASPARSGTSAISATSRSITCGCDRRHVMKSTVTNRTRLVERPITWDDKVWLSWRRMPASC